TVVVFCRMSVLTPQLIAGGAVVLGAGLGGRTAVGMFSPRSSWLLPVVYRGIGADPPRVALTFDDGPLERSTDAILDILKTENVSATFFVVGTLAERRPALVRRIDAEGHLVGNHSHTHARLGLLSGAAYWGDQIRRADDAIHTACQRRPVYFRP